MNVGCHAALLGRPVVGLIYPSCLRRSDPRGARRGGERPVRCRTAAADLARTCPLRRDLVTLRVRLHRGSCGRTHSPSSSDSNRAYLTQSGDKCPERPQVDQGVSGIEGRPADDRCRRNVLCNILLPIPAAAVALRPSTVMPKQMRKIKSATHPSPMISATGQKITARVAKRRKALTMGAPARCVAALPRRWSRGRCAGERSTACRRSAGTPLLFPYEALPARQSIQPSFTFPSGTA
jgi:hypothetical protein